MNIRPASSLLDPDIPSCGTVRPHRARELAQPETDFFLAGMESYGRAPTFLRETGHEQVRSIATYLSGDTQGSGLPPAGKTPGACCEAAA